MTQSQGSSPVPGSEFAFSWADFRKIASLVHAESGIVLNDSKVNLVYSRLAKRLRAVSLRSFREYCDLVCSQTGLDERQAMIAALTTNVTSFFREAHHFDYLKTKLLPGLIAQAREGRKVRIWSAGSSSGEEAYSIALSLIESMPDAADADILILASDIDPNMLVKGSTAIYAAKLVESIPAELRRKWLERVQDGGTIAYRIAPRVQDLVRFRELNLLAPWPMRNRFDVIFCRNVMIYFDEATQVSIWNRYAQVLQPGGTLFIGHSERIPLENTPFEIAGQTTYRLKQEPRN